MSKEAMAFLDGMAASWAWQQKGGMKVSVTRATWAVYGQQMCEDRRERLELELLAAERFPE